MCQKKTTKLRPNKTFVEDPEDVDWEPDYTNFIVTGHGGIAMAYSMQGELESEWMLPDQADIETGLTVEDSCYLVSKETQLFEYGITDLEFTADHGKCFEQTIMKFAINDRFLFGSTASNVVLKYSLAEKAMVKNLGKISEANVTAIYASAQFLWVADDQNNLIQFHIDMEEVIQSYPEIFESPIIIMKHFKMNVVGIDQRNNMKLFAAGNKKVKCDFGSIDWTWDENKKVVPVKGDSEDGEFMTAVTLNNYFIWTGSSKGNLKQWNMKNKQLVHVYSNKENVMSGLSMHDHPVASLVVWKKKFMLSGSVFGDFI